MKTMPAGVFKTNCLAVMDEVKAKRETVVITKHGAGRDAGAGQNCCG